MERQIDFSRDRQMLCGGCGRRFVVDLDWINRWEQAKETCPGCGTACGHEDSPRVTLDSGDPALDDERVAQFSWYHTSTQPDWPTRHFDPAAVLTPETRRRMGGEQRVSAWAVRQRAKALHVGTYEAAVHNMLRRIRDQADQRSQFYLYRVRLKPSVVVREGWLVDPSNFVGDVVLDEVCPPGVEVARYLNFHEDPEGSRSRWGGRDRQRSADRCSAPRRLGWRLGARCRRGSRGRERHRRPGDRQAGPLHAAVFVASRPGPRARCVPGWQTAGQPPGPVRVGCGVRGGEDPEQWARRTSGLFELIDDPTRVLAALDQQDPREV
ncbi:hypothetical protein SHKM778_60220 [Streptomyces sp. KM77-8]|uniref:Uncharacterized protein n=1 Tax=Streptomyces haneummycinicus TaxID=3074435 RepID=A0AAT9HQA0_9ACTN